MPREQWRRHAAAEEEEELELQSAPAAGAARRASALRFRRVCGAEHGVFVPQRRRRKTDAGTHARKARQVFVRNNRSQKAARDGFVTVLAVQFEEYDPRAGGQSSKSRVG